MASTARKSQLTITRCIVSSDEVTLDRSTSFTAMLNPTDFSHTRGIIYNTQPTQGQVGNDAKFAAMKPDSAKFSLLFDGTGAVPRVPGEPIREVAEHIKNLNDVIYKYDGDNHEPAHVRLLWGTFYLYARLAAMTLQYTLFKPNGEPLRAKVELEFISFLSPKQAEREANKRSPDISHIVVVTAGDTLPLLCQRIYGDPAYYPEVARFNALADFRRLQPGARLYFPPLA
ncbi:MAG: hypothetical protein WA840_09590 [Caulobacteraceae bacterium]